MKCWTIHYTFNGYIGEAVHEVFSTEDATADEVKRALVILNGWPSNIQVQEGNMEDKK